MARCSILLVCVFIVVAVQLCTADRSKSGKPHKKEKWTETPTKHKNSRPSETVSEKTIKDRKNKSDKEKQKCDCSKKEDVDTGESPPMEKQPKLDDVIVKVDSKMGKKVPKEKKLSTVSESKKDRKISESAKETAEEEPMRDDKKIRSSKKSEGGRRARDDKAVSEDSKSKAEFKPKKDTRKKQEELVAEEEERETCNEGVPGVEVEEKTPNEEL